ASPSRPSDADGSPAPAAPVERPRNPAAVSLQTTAEEQRAAGDLERAAATLERALRIDSRDPRLWLALAEIRLEQGDRAQASGLARRAETLAPAGSPEAARARALAARAAGD
ncbi:MAG: tetratricopeptide repeat protein, partial [Gammaproteobacteria bacterium]